MKRVNPKTKNWEKSHPPVKGFLVVAKIKIAISINSSDPTKKKMREKPDVFRIGRDLMMD
jgi:hypothetical protein